MSAYPAIKDPDEVLWRWIELRERLASPPSQSIVADRGLIFARRCPQCGAQAANRTSIVKKGATAYRCAQCSGVWPSEFGYLLKNQVDSPPSRGLDGALAMLGTYSNALRRLNLREQRIYLLLYLYERTGTHQDVAIAANRRWPRMRPMRAGRVVASSWSEWHVKRTISTARDKIRRGLRRRVPKCRHLSDLSLRA